MKAKILLAAIVIIATLTTILSANARNNHVIYRPNPITTSICNIALIGKGMVPIAQGTYMATELFGAPCVPSMAYDVEN